MAQKILLIDDSRTQLESLKMRLEKSNFEVVTAADGLEGYKKVFENAPDLILSDIIMPNLNGYQLCRLIKNNPVTKSLPVILLTVLDKKIDKFWGKKSGANKFISKTADFEVIENEINLQIEKHPINQETKNLIKENKVGSETVQNQITNILDDFLMNSTFLNEFRDLSEYLSHEKVLVEKTFELLGSFVDYNIAGLFINNPDRNEKKNLHFDINKNPVSGFVLEKLKRDFFNALPNSENISVRDISHDVFREVFEDSKMIVNPDSIKSQVIIPLVSDGKLLGGLCFFSKEECNYEESKFYKTMIRELTVLLKIQYLYSETEYLSVIDGLTGLYNRRHFETNLEREFLRVKRYPAELSIAMIDIDHFKNINDTYGHQFGDYVLREISKIISSSFRKTDMIYRYGGEEIVIILTETSIEGAKIPLERLREKISQKEFCYNEKSTNITISIGLSCYTENFNSQTQLVAVADKALYSAKQNGRNRLVSFTHEQLNNNVL